jgi:hypothetical protein
MSRLILAGFVILFSSSLFAGTAQKSKGWTPWYTTHGLDKFPCMNEKETQYFTRLINVKKNEERSTILADHRRRVKPSSRMPASVSPNSIISHKFICPPFRGVRNPYEQVIDFGKASTFERVKITDSKMQILNGLSKNERWDLHYNNSKGYFEGQTKNGTPMNIIPLVPPHHEKVRFLIHYLLWKDKTPPTLTLCYREDLHNQCNPYKKPEPAADPTATPEGRQPASVQPVKPSKG